MPAPQQLLRRRFLQSTFAAATCAIAAPARAADPPQRNGKPHFKLSLAAYSFHRQLPRGWPKPEPSKATMNLEDFIEFCAEMNLDGTELTSYYFPAAVTPEYLIHLKELTFRLGLDVSGTAIGNNFCVAPGSDRDFEISMTKAWIDYAALLGAPVIRIFAGSVPKGDTESAALDRCVAGINECVQYAATKGVVLALENHGGITATADQLLAIVKRVDPSPWFGVNFDSGNFNSADPYAELERVAPYAMNAQLKVSVTAAGQRQRSNFARVVNILKQAGYRGYLVLEYEEPEEPRERIPAILDELRTLIA
ncbi:MAG: sugar phosphate isomerase/epimerase family protein [Planctomycetaceae bacterium]